MVDSKTSDRFFDGLSKLSTLWDWTPQWLRTWGLTVLTMISAAWLARLRQLAPWEILLIAVWSGAGVAILVYYVSQTLRFGPRVTFKSLQSVVRDWADKTAVGVDRLNDPTFHWAYKMKMYGDTVVAVAHLKADEKHLVFGGSLQLTDELGRKFAALSLPRKQEILAELKVEVAKLNLQWAGFSLPVEKLSIERRLPITRELTEYQFAEVARSIQNAVLMIGSLIALRAGYFGDTTAAPDNVGAS